MNYLTAIENDFLNSLKVDHKNRKEKSFFQTIFLGGMFEDDIDFKKNLEINISLSDYKDNDPEGYRLLSQTQWLFELLELTMIGKYKEHFIGTASEGKYFSMGLEIQNLPLYLISMLIADLDEDRDRANKKFFQYAQVNLEEYLKDYKEFCQKYNLIFQDTCQYVINQTQTFFIE